MTLARSAWWTKGGTPQRSRRAPFRRNQYRRNERNDEGDGADRQAEHVMLQRQLAVPPHQHTPRCTERSPRPVGCVRGRASACKTKKASPPAPADQAKMRPVAVRGRDTRISNPQDHATLQDRAHAASPATCAAPRCNPSAVLSKVSPGQCSPASPPRKSVGRDRITTDDVEARAEPRRQEYGDDRRDQQHHERRDGEQDLL